MLPGVSALGVASLVGCAQGRRDVRRDTRDGLPRRGGLASGGASPGGSSSLLGEQVQASCVLCFVFCVLCVCVFVCVVRKDRRPI